MKLVISSRLAPIHREVILKAWKPIFGSMASEFIALEGDIKQSFFGTFGTPGPIDCILSE